MKTAVLDSRNIDLVAEKVKTRCPEGKEEADRIANYLKFMAALVGGDSNEGCELVLTEYGVCAVSKS